MKKNIIKLILSSFVVKISVLYFSTAVFAAGSGMPWESTISRITNSMTGPVAKAIGTISIMFACFGFAKSEHGEMLRTFFGICIALSAAFTAGTVIIPMLGFSGGIGF